MSYEVLGIGAPFVDNVIPVSEEYLASLPGGKGGMLPVSLAEFSKILEHGGSSITLAAGGSSSNTIKGLANLGHKCALVGTIGADAAGAEYLNSIKQLNITSLHTPTNSPTGQLACLVTPDGQRTFRNYLGASQDMKPEYLNPSMFEGVSLVHIEGYTLMNEAVTERAMELAKQAGAKVSFDLASFELAANYKDQIIHLLSRHVDILFANVDETRALTSLPPEKGCDILRDMCEIVVVLMGIEGGWIGTQGHKFKYEAYPVNPLDTTGAGDLFAAGFLHGVLTGQHLRNCAHFGALAGAEVVQVIGAEIPQAIWDDLRTKIHKHALSEGYSLPSVP